MPQIYSATGVLKTPDLSITKSFGSLIFKMNKNPMLLTNEKITMWVERPGAQNVYLCNNLDFKSFLYATHAAQRTTLHQDPDGNFVSIVDIGLGMGLKLNIDERLKFNLSSILAADSYIINYVEDFENSTAHISFDAKSMLQGQTDVEYTVANYDHAVIKLAGVYEIGIKMFPVPGVTVGEIRYSPFELKWLQREENAFFAVIDNQILTDDPDYLVLPLIGINSIKLYKEASGTVPLVFLKTGELSPAVKSK